MVHRMGGRIVWQGVHIEGAQGEHRVRVQGAQDAQGAHIQAFHIQVAQVFRKYVRVLGCMNSLIICKGSSRWSPFHIHHIWQKQRSLGGQQRRFSFEENYVFQIRPPN